MVPNCLLSKFQIGWNSLFRGMTQVTFQPHYDFFFPSKTHYFQLKKRKMPLTFSHPPVSPTRTLKSREAHPPLLLCWVLLREAGVSTN